MYGMVVHGGAGGTSSVTERGCRGATELGMEILRKGGSALDAAVEAVRCMEDSGHFNAGTGSVLRVDGSIEMEAVIATSQGLQRTVEVVSGVKNPVLVARDLVSTDLRRISGIGATQFALERGLAPHPGPTERTRERLELLRQEVKELLARGEVSPGWTIEELRRFIESGGSDGNAPLFLAVINRQHDTVGAVALDKAGVFALAASTGGSGLMRRGRGGDVPIRGAGFQVGEIGGVLATGVGEFIIDKEGSQKVFQLFTMGFSPQHACEQALTFFAPDLPVGFIALSRDATGIAANCPMASYSITE